VIDLAHPKYELPKTPHAEYRYKMAMKHVEAVKAAGKSSEEIHEVFNKIMNYDMDNLADDEAHKKYRMAVDHAKKALENGKTSEEAHKIFRQVLESNGEGHCHKHE
jgi:fatty acid-binding protein DegV